jgi:hypothetical protein
MKGTALDRASGCGGESYPGKNKDKKQKQNKK